MFRKNDQHLQQSFISGLNELPPKLKTQLENSWAGAFYREVFIRIDEAPYAVLYADIASRPNVAVNILVGLELLKAGHGWSDEEMYENFCYNIQVRYALGLRNLGEGHFDLRTIYVFRRRLAEHMQHSGENLFEQTFEQVTDEQLAKFKLKSNQQRVDSTQIASNIRETSRLQLLVEVLQRVHRMLSRADQPQWQAEFEPYLKGTSGQYTYRLKGEGAHRPHLEKIGVLMSHLIKELAATYQEHETYQILVRVFNDHFTSTDDGPNPKNGDDLKADSLQSPDDLEASYRSKQGEGYVGYVANITETSHADNDFQLILKVQTEPNTTDDAHMLAQIVPELKARTDLELMNADGSYGSPKVDEVLAEYGVELHQTAIRGRVPAENTFNLAACELELDPESRTLVSVTTPAGEQLPVEAGRKPGRFIIRPPKSPDGLVDPPSTFYFSQQQVDLALRRQRCAQLKLDGKNPRAAVEATVGAIKRPFSNDKTPVRGKFRVGMMVIGSALMVNLRRIQRFQTEQRQKMAKDNRDCGAQTLLSQFFRRRFEAFLSQFYSVVDFTLLYT